MAKRRKKINGASYIDIHGEYADLTIYSGEYTHYNGNRSIWIQANDDCEGNPNGNPGANIEVSEICIKLLADEFSKEWEVPEYKDELDEISNEINDLLSKYFSQFEYKGWVKKESI